MRLIPAPIARACQAAEQSDSDLPAAAEAALAFARESQVVLEDLATTLVGAQPLLESIRAELEAQVEACQALAGGGGTAALRSAAERLQELYFELREAQLSATSYSPFGAVDRFVKIGMNVLDGALPPVHVQSRLPAVATLANTFEDDAYRFERFYGRTPALETVHVGLQEVHAGLGAAAEFVQNGARSTLADSLKLLVAGFGRIQASLAQLEETARARHDQVVLGELSAACRTGEQRLIRSAWVGLEKTFYGLGAGLDSFRDFPYTGLMAMEHALAQRAVSDLGTLMTRLHGNPQSGLPELEKALAAAVAATELLYRRRQEELERYARAPELEQLRELVFRVGQGECYRHELKERIERFRGRLAEIEPGGELAEIVARQEAALALMESDPPAGWAALEADLPRLMELTEAALASVGVEKKSSSVSCMRCGAANAPDRRTCTSCQAVLPAVAPTSGPTEYQDIIGGPEPEAPVARELLRLEELVREAESGGSDPAGIAREVDQLLARADSLLNQFDQTVVPVAQRDQTVAAYAQFFEDRVQDFVEGLAVMRDAGGPGSLRRGFEMCRQAGDELMAMRSRLSARE